MPFFQRVIGTAAFPAQNWLFLFAWLPALLFADEARKALLRWRDARAIRR
jgi:P-type Ca2+ transporter type 2C